MSIFKRDLMQYLVTKNKDRVPKNAQVFVVGNAPLGWVSKLGDFCWSSDRNDEQKHQIPIIDTMPTLEPEATIPNLLQYCQTQPKQCIVSATVNFDVCVAATWLQLDHAQQKDNGDRLRAIAINGEYFSEYPDLLSLKSFAATARKVLHQEELKLVDKVGELLGAAAFWSGGKVRLKQRELEGEITHIHMNDRCVEVHCGSHGTHLSDYWNTTFPSDRACWSDSQVESFASLAFRVQTEWLIAACRGDRSWPGELEVAVTQSESDLLL